MFPPAQLGLGFTKHDGISCTLSTILCQGITWKIPILLNIPSCLRLEYLNDTLWPDSLNDWNAQETVKVEAITLRAYNKAHKTRPTMKIHRMLTNGEQEDTTDAGTDEGQCWSGRRWALDAIKTQHTQVMGNPSNFPPMYF